MLPLATIDVSEFVNSIVLVVTLPFTAISSKFDAKFESKPPSPAILVTNNTPTFAVP